MHCNPTVTLSPVLMFITSTFVHRPPPGYRGTEPMWLRVSVTWRFPVQGTTDLPCWAMLSCHWNLTAAFYCCFVCILCFMFQLQTKNILGGGGRTTTNALFNHHCHHGTVFNKKGEKKKRIWEVNLLAITCKDFFSPM